ncbi:hypothetical protein bcgnr5372_39010 [Bacillus luti]|nr:hypothetical protein [Bacillus cereus]HDR8330815.1 hypothetical protein [Bacillus cereus]HDR8337486.1 hypothetical protein [Bacillus cereus]
MYSIYRVEYQNDEEEVFYGLTHDVLSVVNNISVPHKVLSGGSYDSITDMEKDMEFLRDLNEIDVRLTEVSNA